MGIGGRFCLVAAITSVAAVIVRGFLAEDVKVRWPLEHILRVQADRQIAIPTDDLAIDRKAALASFLDCSLGHAPPAGFVPLWSDDAGSQLGAALLGGATGHGAIWVLTADARARDLYDFECPNERETRATAGARFAAILDGLITPSPGPPRLAWPLVATAPSR